MTNRINIFAATMQNYDNVLRYTIESQNAAGTSAQKYQAYMDSIGARLATLTATWEQFVNNLNQGGTFKTVVDLGTKLVEVLDFLINKLGLLKVIIPALGFTQLINWLKKGDFYLAKLGQRTVETNKTAKQLSTTFSTEFGNAMKSGFSSTESFDYAISSIVNDLKKLDTQQKIAVINTMSLSKEQKIAALEATGMSNAEATAAVSTSLLSTASGVASGVIATLKNTFIGLKAAIMSNPIGFLVTVITTAISVFATFHKSAEEIKQDAEEIRDSFDSNVQSINNNIDIIKGLKNEYEELSRYVKEDGKITGVTTEQKERYYDITKQIADVSPDLVMGYDEEGNALIRQGVILDDIIEKLERKIELENAQKLTDRNTLFKDSLNDYSEAQDNLDSVNRDKNNLDKVIKDYEERYEYITELKRKLIEEGTDGQGNIESVLNNYEKQIQGIERLLNNFYTQRNVYLSQISLYENQIAEANQQIFDDIGKSYLAINDAYQEMDSGLQNIISDVSSQINIEEVGNADAYISKINEIISTVQNFTQEQKEALISFDVTQALFEAGEVSFTELKEKYENIVQQLGEDNVVVQVSITPDFELEESKLDELQELLPNITREELEGLTLEEIEIALNIEWDVEENDFGVVKVKIEEAKDETEELKELLSEPMQVVWVEDIADGMEALSTKTDILRSAMEDLNEDGYISASVFKKIIDNNLLDYLEKTENGFRINQSALDDLRVSSIEEMQAQLQASFASDLYRLATEGLTDAEYYAQEQSNSYGNVVSTLTGKLKTYSGQAITAAQATNLLNSALGGATDAFAGKKRQLDELVDFYNKANSAISALNVEVKNSASANSGAASAAKSHADALKDLATAAKEAQKALEDERKAVEDLEEMAIKMLKQKYKTQEEGIKKLKDEENELYEAEKKRYEKEVEDLERKYEDYVEQLKDTKDELKDAHDDELDALEKEQDAHEKLLEAQKKELKQQKEKDKYENKLKDKTKEVAKIEAELAKLQFDDSVEAQKKKIELMEELEEKQKDVDELQQEHSYDLQEDALDNELDRYKEMMKKKKEELKDLNDEAIKAIEKELDELKHQHTEWKRMTDDQKDADKDAHDAKIKEFEDQIDKIKEYYSVEGNLRNEWRETSESDQEAIQQFYEDLIQWNRDYGTGVDEDVSQAWNRAYEVLDKYEYKTVGVKQAMENLAKAVQTAEAKTKELEAAANDAKSAYDGISSSIGGSSNSVTSNLDRAIQRAKDFAKAASDAEVAAKRAAEVDFADKSDEIKRELIAPITDNSYQKTKDLQDLARSYNSARTASERTEYINIALSTYNTSRSDFLKIANSLKFNHTGDPFVNPDDKERKISKALGLKSDEVIRILKAGEAVIPKEQNMERINKNYDLLKNSVANQTETMQKEHQIYSNNSNVSIVIGDTIVQGSADKSTVECLNEYKKSIVNEVFSKINKHTNLSGFRSVKNYV